ncbi:MAG TPA: ATPase, T2SS/T4P/T4SS family, partial [Armatimonadota bacterium]|nr:ATPase, T2SS/T4P/T4SS family [Armatimonadota bacterium]
TGKRGDISRVIVEQGFANDKAVAKARAQLMGVNFVDLAQFKINQEAVRLVKKELAQRYNLIPVQRLGQRLFVAMQDPANVIALDDLKLVTGMQVVAALATAGDIEDALSKFYAGEADSEESADSSAVAPVVSVSESNPLTDGQEALKALASMGDNAALDEMPSGADDGANDAPIIRVVNAIMQQAIKDGASDIHVEPGSRFTRVRYRIDGVLHEIMQLPKYLQPPLLSRIKIMSEMNIAERRVPQDGRIGLSYNGKDFDMRVNVLPTVFGEKAVMRILDKSSVMIGLNKLGFMPETLAQLESVIIQPNGMILSTGPTGSGKTTTQYSVLNKINSVEKNIITIEDPVEYQLPGISQVQVNRKAGLTFATALRAFLRQDPDIVMVGEIRDLETAETAIEASLTGHLVLSTLHTNDAPSAVTRLVDMGVEPFLISASLVGVLAQRLARRICPKCKVPYNPPPEAIARLGIKQDPDAPPPTFYRGKGCEYCRHTGYKGRTGIHEMLLLNDEINDLVVRRAPLSEIREAGRANGMRLLREDGLAKVLEGTTTVEEVLRVVFTAGQTQ